MRSKELNCIFIFTTKMAVLFTVNFPKYIFELQDEFTITFPDAQNLPFDVAVSDRGIPHVINDHGVPEWTEQGLKVGLRLSALNGHPIARTQTAGDIEVVNLTKQDVDVLFADIEGAVDITFTEHIPDGDSVPVGLSWSESKTDSESAPSIQISASSHHQGYPPSAARLNDPEHCWRPSIDNEVDGNVWISFDFGTKRVIDGVQLQGSPDGQCHVRRLWVDFSDDGCSWTTHPLRQVRCQYIESQRGSKTMHRIARTKDITGV